MFYNVFTGAAAVIIGLPHYRLLGGQGVTGVYRALTLVESSSIKRIFVTIRPTYVWLSFYSFQLSHFFCILKIFNGEFKFVIFVR